MNWIHLCEITYRWRAAVNTLVCTWRGAFRQEPPVLSRRSVVTQRCEADAWPGRRMTNAALPAISPYAFPARTVRKIVFVSPRDLYYNFQEIWKKSGTTALGVTWKHVFQVVLGLYQFFQKRGKAQKQKGVTLTFYSPVVIISTTYFKNQQHCILYSCVLYVSHYFLEQLIFVIRHCMTHGPEVWVLTLNLEPNCYSETSVTTHMTRSSTRTELCSDIVPNFLQSLRTD